MLSTKLLRILKVARLHELTSRNYEAIGFSKVPATAQTAAAAVPVYKADEYDGLLFL